MSKTRINKELYNKYLNPRNMDTTPNDDVGFGIVYDYVMAYELNAKTNAKKQKADKMYRVLFGHYEMMRYNKVFK